MIESPKYSHLEIERRWLVDLSAVDLASTARQQDDAIVVGRLYVLPQYQRRGIGRQLLESSYATFRGAQRARLTVEAENRKGVSFYAKQGFRETARTFEDVAGARLENVVMERPL